VTTDGGDEGTRTSLSTAPETSDPARLRRGRLGRRLFFVAVTLFLLLGILNVYGVRTRETSATASGYELTVTYASVTRPGLATPWSVEVRHPGGFDSGLVTVAATSSYFDAFDENGLDPDPARSTSDGERTIWQFEPPTGDTLTISFDARIEPGVQLTRLKGEVEVLGPSGDAAVSADFSTYVMP
jgi:hypothetical protein